MRDDVADSERDSEGDFKTELSRDMGLLDITFIGVGAMIGAGVFALTGFAAGLAGPALIVSFFLNGFVALFTAMSYAELGAAFPEAGGGYLWVKEALADPNGFYAGWMSWFAHAVACSLYAVTFGVFFTEFVVQTTALEADFVLFGVLSRLLTEKALATVMVGVFAYINYKGAKSTGSAGIIVTGIKIIILGVFIVFGVKATLSNPNWPQKFVHSPRFAPSGVVGIIGAMGFTYIAFEGYEIIVQSGEEVVEPGTNVPKAVFYSLAIVVPIYVLVAFAAIGGIDVTPEIVKQLDIVGPAGGLPPTWKVLGELGELGIIEAAGQFVPYGAPLLLVAGLAATMSALNATIYSSSRVSFAMGRDRSLPKVFHAVHPDNRTPYWAIGLSATLITVMAVILPIEAVAASADIMFILLFVQVNWTVIKMRRTHPDLPRTYTVPSMPWPPLIGIGLQLLLTPFLLSALGLQIGLGEDSHGFIALIATVVWMGLGLAVYYGYTVREEAEKLERETPTVATEQAPPSDREQCVLVPIANPENVEPFMRIALDIARERNAEVEVLTVVTVPQQTPLDNGRQFVDEHRSVVDDALSFANETDPDTPVNGKIRIGHDVATAILNTVEQDDINLVLLGWRGEKRRRDYVLGSNVDTVVTNAECDVLVKRIGHDEPIESILLPTAGGPHAELAAEVTHSIATVNDASVEVIHVTPPQQRDDERIQGWFEDTQTILEGVETETHILESDEIAETIIDRSAATDITIIGSTRESLLQRLVFGDLPETVGRHAHGTVIMAKKHTNVVSKIARWITGHRS